MEEGSRQDMQSNQTKEELRQLELDIANEQQKYLTKTHRRGNLLTGFNGCINRKILPKEKGRSRQDQQQRPAVIRNEERMFSLSSMTSEVSLMRVQPRAELTIVEPLPARRVTRSSLERERREEQEKYEREEEKQEQLTEQFVAEEMDQPDEYSVAHSLNRQGSFHRNHAPLKEAHRRFRSQGEQRTLSYSQASPTQSTESLSECQKQRCKSRANSQADKKSVPPLKLRRKRIKKTASLPKAQPAGRKLSESELQLQKSQMAESEMLRDSIVPSLKSYNSADMEFQSDKSNSEDSVDDFIRLANLQDTQD